MRLLEKLRESNVTTIEARRDLDILMPAARVFELRAIGHDIATRLDECAKQIAVVLIALPAMCWRGRQAVNDENWLERLQTLFVRFSHLGLTDDMAGLSLIELWGLYRFLSRLADG